MLFHSFFSYLEYLVILFDADAPAVCIEGCDGGRHTSSRIVEDKVSIVGIGLYEPFYEGYWLLGAMEEILVLLRNPDDAYGELLVGYDNFRLPEVSIAAIFAPPRQHFRLSLACGYALPS